jgi:hypothetical protein
MTKAFLIASLLLCLGCAGSNEFVRPGTDFSKYRRIAVLPLVDFPNSPQSGVQVADMLSMRLLATDAIILDRSQTSQLLSEQQFGLSGLTDENTAPRLGNILGVQALITGSVYEWQTGCNDIQVVRGAAPAILCISTAGITLKLIDVETGQIVWAGSARGSKVGIDLQSIAANQAVVRIVEKQLMVHLRSQAKSPEKFIQSEKRRDHLQPLTLTDEGQCKDKCELMHKRGELRVSIEDCIRAICK